MGAQYKPGLENVIAVETEISILDVEHEQIIIKGYDLIELAQTKKYIDLVYLMLYGELPTIKERQSLEHKLVAAPQIPDYLLSILKLLPQQTHPMDALRTGISALSGLDSSLDDYSPTVNRQRALFLLGQIPQIVAASYRILSHQPMVTPCQDLTYTGQFLYGITGQIPTKLEEQIFDQTMILYSEHELPNSTFTARVIASTLSDLYGALSGAVASLKGRLHGGANEAVMELLQSVTTPEQLETLMLSKLQKKERIMGFGHRVYMRNPDPRAVMLKQSLALLCKEKQQENLYGLCAHGEKVMYREKKLYSNLDYYAAPIYHLLGIPTPLFTPIFLASRSIGLCTHVIEQHEYNRLFRPRVRYVGRHVK